MAGKKGKRSEAQKGTARKNQTRLRRNGRDAKRSERWDFDPAQQAELWGAEVSERVQPREDSPFSPRQDEAHEDGQDFLFWWYHPNDGRVLVFDAHGFTVDEAVRVFRVLRKKTSGKYVYVIHGYHGGTAIRDRMNEMFRGAITTYPKNKGLSRITIK